MTIKTERSPDGSEFTIAVEGRFDFNAHREFRDAVKSMDKGTRCVVDLASTIYLDSSALGMLLLLKDQASDVRIIKCTPDVKKVLQIANFDRIFTVA